MIEPLFCSRMSAAALRVPFQQPLRWTLMTWSKCSSVIVRIVASRVIPALLTMMSTEPNVSRAVCMSRSMSSDTVTSHREAAATDAPPSDPTARSFAASSRSPKTTLAPPETKASAIASPMP